MQSDLALIRALIVSVTFEPQLAACLEEEREAADRPAQEFDAALRAARKSRGEHDRRQKQRQRLQVSLSPGH
jgi:hypothetical protein